MERPSRQQLYGVIGTLLFHLIIGIILLTQYLRYDPTAEADRVWPPVDSSEILFGGEYVALGELPDAEQNEKAAVQETTPEPEAPFIEEKAPETPAMTDNTTESKVSSPAKVTPKPKEEPKPEKPRIDPAAQQRANEQAATSQATQSRVSNAFASSSNNSKTSSGGSPNGNATSGATSGQPGVSLGGRSLTKWVKAHGNAVGTITIDITVNRQGKVVAATYNAGKSSGAVAASTEARNSCISAAKQCTFSAVADGPDSQKGTISFKFK